MPKTLVILFIYVASCCVPAAAQVVLGADAVEATVEAYVNVTAGEAGPDRTSTGASTSDARIDAALRVLVRSRGEDGSDWGVRVVAEQSPERDLDLAEASLLYFGTRGRLEAGERQGLPDVLTGYAPNNFAFTSAEFGPASGPSLDPGSPLPVSFLSEGLAAQFAELAPLGATASLADDRSAKLLYVSPKTRGYLAGLSFAPDADDDRFGRLAQTGVTREWYWSQHVLRTGGSYAYAEGRSGQADLHSFNAGVSAVLSDALALGIAATWNGDSGLPLDAVHASDAWGLSASINYNTGPWTVGGYAQHARGEGDTDTRGRDRLDVVELGVSWRYSTRLRLYGAAYHWRFSDEGAARDDGQVYLLGIRATL